MRDVGLTWASSIVTLLFTALFLPWAFWMSAMVMQTRVDMAIVKTKLKFTKGDYDAFYGSGNHSNFAIPSLPIPEKKP